MGSVFRAAFFFGRRLTAAIEKAGGVAPALSLRLCYTRPHACCSKKTLSRRRDGACLSRFFCAHAPAAHGSKRRTHERSLSIRRYLAAASQWLPPRRQLHGF